MKKYLLVLALGFTVTSAYAGNDNANPCGNNGNNCNPSSTATGGAGGHGGTGVGVGVGIAGASATGGNATGGTSNVDVRNTNTNVNANTSANTNVNGQVQGQSQEQYNSQGQAIDGSANNSGVTGNSVSIQVAAPKTYRPPVSSAIAPTIFPTAPCMGSSSVGATGTLFSISGGSSWTSEECMILETARSFDQAGYTQDGLAVRCQGKWAKNAPSCKALEPVASKPASKAVATTEVKASTKPVAVKSVAQTQTVETASSGYYSVNTNPLTK